MRKGGKDSFAKSIEPGQPAQSAADMGRNFSLSVNFRQESGPFYITTWSSLPFGKMVIMGQSLGDRLLVVFHHGDVLSPFLLDYCSNVI